MKMPWVLHTTWQITLGSLHLIIHFNAHLNEEVQEIEKYIIFSKCFVIKFFHPIIFQIYWIWLFIFSIWMVSINIYWYDT